MKRDPLPLLLALALGATLIVILATRFGIGITPDSTVYIDAARNLANGRGLVALAANGQSKPLNRYPPLYPAAIAAISAAGISAETAARWLNALLFGANIFLVGWALSVYASDSFWLPLLGSFLTLTATDVAGIHTFALTEPLFLFFTLLGFIQLAIYFDNLQRGWLISSGIVLGAAFSTRYVGIVLVFTGTAALLVLNGRPLRRKLVDAVTFAAVACLPVALWAIRNHQVAAEAADRSLVFHPIKVGQIVSGVSTVSSWLLLGKVRGDLRVIAFGIQLVLMAAVIVYVFLKRRQQVAGNPTMVSLQRLPAILSIFIVSNISFLIFTASFIDADTVLDHRSLVAVHVAALILVLILLWNLYRSANLARRVRIGLVVLALAFAGSYSFHWVKWFVNTRVDGQGYVSRTWKESETIARIRMLPQGTPIYSNGYDAIYYLTGRPAIYLPERVIHGTGRSNQHYMAELESMLADLDKHQAVLVYFNTLPERWFLPTESELKSQVPLIEMAKFADGSVYGVK